MTQITICGVRGGVELIQHIVSSGGICSVSGQLKRTSHFREKVLKCPHPFSVVFHDKFSVGVYMRIMRQHINQSSFLCNGSTSNSRFWAFHGLSMPFLQFWTVRILKMFPKPQTAEQKIQMFTRMRC